MAIGIINIFIFDTNFCVSCNRRFGKCIMGGEQGNSVQKTEYKYSFESQYVILIFLKRRYFLLNIRHFQTGSLSNQILNSKNLPLSTRQSGKNCAFKLSLINTNLTLTFIIFVFQYISSKVKKFIQNPIYEQSITLEHRQLKEKQCYTKSLSINQE